MLDLLRKHDRLMNKITLEDEDRDDWERLAKLVEEKLTSTNKPSAKCDTCETCLHEDCLSCVSGENYRFE